MSSRGSAYWSTPRRTIRGTRRFHVTPSGEDLERIAALVEAGRLHVHVAEVLPLADAAKAHELSETGRARGKMVLKV